VRSVPFSRWCPWFSAKALAERLAGERIAYIALGDALGGRPRDPMLYREGVADYEAMAARPEFAAGLARVMDATARRRVCLLCAEREPLDCHRCLLVGRALCERATEERLLALAGDEADLFRRGKAILGDSAGGLIKNLIKAKSGNIALARAAIETASTKQDPREYIAACIHGPDTATQRANGWDPRL